MFTVKEDEAGVVHFRGPGNSHVTSPGPINSEHRERCLEMNRQWCRKRLGAIMHNYMVGRLQFREDLQVSMSEKSRTLIQSMGVGLAKGKKQWYVTDTQDPVELTKAEIDSLKQFINTTTEKIAQRGAELTNFIINATDDEELCRIFNDEKFKGWPEEVTPTNQMFLA